MPEENPGRQVAAALRFLVAASAAAVLALGALGGFLIGLLWR